MLLRNIATGLLVLLAVIGLFATPSLAGLLDSGVYDGWIGTTDFTCPWNQLGLTGTVDWAVYSAGQFPYVGTGYTPSDNELTYVYQIHSNGTDQIHEYQVYLYDVADNPGSFSTSVSDIPVSFMQLDPEDSVYWQFAGIGIDQSSVALVYSSTNKPDANDSITINGGTFAVVEPVPSPGSNPIPEPITLWSLLIGLGLLTANRWFRRG